MMQVYRVLLLTGGVGAIGSGFAWIFRRVGANIRTHPRPGSFTDRGRGGRLLETNDVKDTPLRTEPKPEGAGRQKLRIAIMLRHMDQHEGGVKVYTHNVLPRLLAQGSHHEFILIYSDKRHLGTFAGRPNVKEVVCPVPGRLAWDQIGVPWMLRKKKVDVVFNPKFSIPFWSGAKTVFVMHGSEWFVIPETFQAFDRFYFKRMVPLYCRRADAIFAVSAVVGRDVVQHTGIDSGKIIPIHNGFDERVFRPVVDEGVLARMRERYRLPARFVLWVGQMYPPKNLARLIQAFARIKDKVPHDLLLCGREVWKGKGGLEQIIRLGIADRVHILDWVSHEDLPALYSLADLFVLPSLYEGFGIPLIEAMACGCPVLTSKAGSPPEIVGDAAVLVDPYDVNDISGGMFRVLSDASVRLNMAEKGFRQARNFSWDKCAATILHSLEKVGSCLRQ